MTYEEYEKRRIHYRETALRHLENGVDILDLDSVFIDDEVVIGEGTFIGPCVRLLGKTEVGPACRIGQNSRLENAVIGRGTKIESSVILDSRVGEESDLGPFCYIRPGSRIGNHCKVGDFVEVKNSTFDDGSKTAHLTYIGDTDVGKDVNFGCGVVLVNYDGNTKFRSRIGDSCFIGCNSNIVSPVTIGDGAYIAAGSTVTEDVPEDALCVARARQVNKEGWAARRGLYRKKREQK